jgi:hypothetical protein
MIDTQSYNEELQKMKAVGKSFEKVALENIGIISPYLFRIATREEDQQLGYDIISKIKSVSIRGVSFETFPSFSHNFTIRTKVPSGVETELDKILKPNGAEVLWYCYQQDMKIKEWVLINLRAFREVYTLLKVEGRLQGKCFNRVSPNGSEFLAVDIKRFGKEKLVIASSFPIC